MQALAMMQAVMNNHAKNVSISNDAKMLQYLDDYPDSKAKQG